MPSVTRALFACVGALAALGPVAVQAQARCDAPQVLLVVDKSSSMLGEVPSGGTKWQAATTSIGEITRAFESNIDFGLMVFPHGAGGECTPGMVDMEVGAHASGEIVAALGSPPPPPRPRRRGPPAPPPRGRSRGRAPPVAAAPRRARATSCSSRTAGSG